MPLSRRFVDPGKPSQDEFPELWMQVELHCGGKTSIGNDCKYAWKGPMLRTDWTQQNHQAIAEFLVEHRRSDADCTLKGNEDDPGVYKIYYGDEEEAFGLPQEYEHPSPQSMAKARPLPPADKNMIESCMEKHQQMQKAASSTTNPREGKWEWKNWKPTPENYGGGNSVTHSYEETMWKKHADGSEDYKQVKCHVGGGQAPPTPPPPPVRDSYLWNQHAF